MERGEFFSQLREEMAKSAANDDVPVERLKEVAQKAVEAGAEKEDVSENVLKSLRNDFPDVLSGQDKPADGESLPAEEAANDGLEAVNPDKE